jgi:hypothetical protein
MSFGQLLPGGAGNWESEGVTAREHDVPTLKATVIAGFIVKGRRETAIYTHTA